VNLNWLSSLWEQNSARKLTTHDGPNPAETQAFGRSRYEFMLDNLMDVPNEPIDKVRPRQ
jgi:hypothetical protein